MDIVNFLYLDFMVWIAFPALCTCFITTARRAGSI